MSMSVTRFERARLIGARALQVSMGAPPLVAINATDPIEIALAEYESGLIPMRSTRVRNARH